MKRQKSILILDDQQSFGEALLDTLNPVYEQVTFCLSPIEAKKLISENTYSMILTDVQMPELPGPEFVKWLRSLGRIEPVIFLTGHATREVILSALRLGASDIIEKPFEQDELLQTIDRVFEIEKRRLQMYESMLVKNDQNAANGQKKMIGLLQVVNEKK